MRPCVCSRISGAGRVVVRAPVPGVVVLVRIEIQVRLLRVHRLGLDDGAVRSFHRIGEHHLGAERLEDPLPLGRHVLGHAQPHAVAARGADHRVGDAGVPGGGVEQDLVAGQRARLLAVGNHPRRRAVLHRPARIAPLRLGVELDVAETRLETRQPDERGVSDQVDDRRDARGLPWGDDRHIRLFQSEIIQQGRLPAPGPRLPETHLREPRAGSLQFTFFPSASQTSIGPSPSSRSGTSIFERSPTAITTMFSVARYLRATAAVCSPVTAFTCAA